MLEFCVDQGVGLRHLGMNAATGVIAVTSHGSDQAELPLLWNICSALIELEYAVTVLDGTVEERENISRSSNAHTYGETLHDCARNFLGCTLSPPLVVDLCAEDGISSNMAHWVTRLLATAMPIDHHLRITHKSRGTQPRAQFSGCH